MPVYRFPSGSASCAVPGCGCWSRSRSYPSVMSDAEWAWLGPEAEAVMAELRKGPGGAPMGDELRVVLDAIGYVTRYEIEWRALPVDFPPLMWNLRSGCQGMWARE